MKYINTETLEYPLNEFRIKAAFPNTSFPIPFEAVPPFELVQPTEAPAYSADFQQIKEGVPVLEGGIWKQTWMVQSKSLPEIQSVFVAAMEKLFDEKAKERRYDSRVTCSLRAGYPGPFQAEGLAFAQWMDACNTFGYQTLGAVLSGQAEMPTVEGFIAMLPVLEWPSV